jgi:hypothetical protein
MKFRNHICIYCGQRPSIPQGDHVFSREFFMKNARDNLPKVPACVVCNTEKSKLEHYLTAVLPFGAGHADAQQNLANMVPKRLAKNVKLHHELHAGRSFMWRLEDNVIRYGMTIPVQPDKIVALARYIAQGLAWYHWGVQLGPEDSSAAFLLSQHGREMFDRVFATKSANHVQQDLGRGTVWYHGVRDPVRPTLTIWRMRFYGDLEMAGDPNAPNEKAGEIGAITGPRRLVTLFDKSTKPIMS